jgi:hypothetical protein
LEALLQKAKKHQFLYEELVTAFCRLLSKKPSEAGFFDSLTNSCLRNCVKCDLNVQADRSGHACGAHCLVR